MRGAGKYILELSIIACLVLLGIAGARCVLGCTPAQRQDARDAADALTDAHALASVVAVAAADAATAAVELDRVTTECVEEVQETLPPEPLAVHPCVWDVLDASRAAAEATQKLAELLSEARR